jgi:hypothetical protein
LFINLFFTKRGERGLIRGMVSLEEEDLLVFNYLCASDIWSDKRGERDLIRGGLLYCKKKVDKQANQTQVNLSS